MSLSTVQDAVVSHFLADSDISAEFGSEVKKGLDRNLKLAEVGRLIRLVSISSSDMNEDAPGIKAYAAYSFTLLMAFVEPDAETAETRKSSYDKMVRDAIDDDPTFGGVCIGTTDTGKTSWAEHPEADGHYYGVMTLYCYRKETRGAR